jgi:predicted dehydrogenase
MSKQSIGLIGCGRWGRHILRDLVGLGCEVAVATPPGESARRARDGGAVTVVDALAALPRVDGIVVATPTVTHASVIEAVLEREVPIFTEKPLTADRASAERLAGMAPDCLFVMDKWRYHPGIEMLGRIARSGELGPVVGLRTTRVQWGNPHADVDGVWILAPHELAIALEVFGCLPAPRSAVTERDREGATGMIGLLGYEPWFVFEVSTASPSRRREMRLHCRDGVAVLDDAHGDAVQVYRGVKAHGMPPTEGERRPVSTELPLLRELRAFVEHLGGGPPPRSSAAEGAAIVAAVSTLRALAGLDGPGGA